MEATKDDAVSAAEVALWNLVVNGSRQAALDAALAAYGDLREQRGREAFSGEHASVVLAGLLEESVEQYQAELAAAEQRGREAALDGLRDVLRYTGVAPTLPIVRDIIVRREAEADRMIAAAQERERVLLAYVHHIGDCDAWDEPDASYENPCTCGLQAALDATARDGVRSE